MVSRRLLLNFSQNGTHLFDFKEVNMAIFKIIIEANLKNLQEILTLKTSFCSLQYLRHNNPQIQFTDSRIKKK
jgi:hypothetical protein